MKDWSALALLVSSSSSLPFQAIFTSTGFISVFSELTNLSANITPPSDHSCVVVCHGPFVAALARCSISSSTTKSGFCGGTGAGSCPLSTRAWYSTPDISPRSLILRAFCGGLVDWSDVGEVEFMALVLLNLWRDLRASNFPRLGD